MGTLVNYTRKSFIKLAPVQTAGLLAGVEVAQRGKKGNQLSCKVFDQEKTLNS